MVRKFIIGLGALFLIDTTLADDGILGQNPNDQGNPEYIAQILVSSDLDVVAVSWDCAMSYDPSACAVESTAYFSVAETQIMDALLTARAQGKPVTYWRYLNKPLLTLFASDSSPGVKGGEIMAVKIDGDPPVVAVSNTCTSWQIQGPTFTCFLSRNAVGGG